MADSSLSLSFTSPRERVFPTLTPAQVARVARHGRGRKVVRGEVLVEPGQQHVPFFVVTAGALEIVLVADGRETLVTVHHAGEFTGEMNMLTNRRSVVRARARSDGELIELRHDELMTLIQVDADLSELLMRAFIMRRAELIAHGVGDAIVVGPRECADTLRLKEFLTRNGHPYAHIDVDQDEDLQDVLRRFRISGDDLPVLICRGDVVLRNPSNAEVAECLGLSDEVDESKVRDVVVVGAGPAGLAAAVYAASEGLDVVVLDAQSPGGQAGTSSRIENYLGFPTGISGQELTARACVQAQKFGARLIVASPAMSLACERHPYVIRTTGGRSIPTRTVIIASGAQYRKLPLPNLSAFEGAGVYYAATFLEAQLCGHEDIVVVGGGNSAGQAAVFLAETVRRVHMLIRGDALADTMSRYLIRRIEEHPRITMHTRTEIAALDGRYHLERVTWTNGRTGATTTRDLRHVFVMTGATPCTGWLAGCLALDAGGFVKTGPDLSADELTGEEWRPGRRPHLLETSLPGVFAVGDVRSGNVKRVASAVGEGSIAVSFVHRQLTTPA